MNFLAMDRADLLYPVKELLRTMSSPCTWDLIDLKRVARYTIEYPRMDCRYLWTPLDSNIEVFGRRKFCWVCLYENVHSWRSRVVERSVCESVVQNDWTSGPEWWRIRTGSTCQSSCRRFWIAILSDFDLCGHVAIKSDAVRCNCCNWDGPSTRFRKSSTFGCGRSMGSASTTHFSVECPAREWTVTEPFSHFVSCSVGGSGSGVRGFVVLGICGTRVRSRVSNDIDRDQQAERCGSRECLRPCENVTFCLC